MATVGFSETKTEMNNNKTIDVNNIPSGYYNIYMTFKDTDDKTDENRVYYEEVNLEKEFP